MPRTGDPLIEPLYYLSEAVAAFELLYEADGARGLFYREVFYAAVRIALRRGTVRLSHLDRLHKRFDAAVGS
jgi:hypothetical protein